MADPATPAQVRAAAAIVEVRGRRDLADALDALAATMPAHRPDDDPTAMCGNAPRAHATPQEDPLP